MVSFRELVLGFLPGMAAPGNKALSRDNNLSELASASAARTNLGLGAAALRSAPLFAYASGDGSPITSNTALADVTGLAVALVPNTTYVGDVTGVYDTGATPDAQFGLTYPSGCTGTWYGGAVKNAADTATNFTAVSIATAIPAGGVASGTILVARYRVLIRVAGTAGNLQVQAAQNTSSGTALIVKADSFMLFDKVA